MGKKKTVFEKALVIWGKNLEKEATRAKSIVRSDYEVVFADGVNLRTRVSEALSSAFLGGGRYGDNLDYGVSRTLILS